MRITCLGLTSNYFTFKSQNSSTLLSRSRFILIESFRRNS
ncbi:hypothetical protein [Escherichia phage FL18]